MNENKTILEIMNPREQKVWHGRYRDIGYKVSLHSIGKSHTPAKEGVWCFYIYLLEDKVINFPAIWLEDEIFKYKPEAKGRISHNYYIHEFQNLELHNGITFYKKHEYTEGFRYVEIGCDYNHLWDQERGYGYELEDILVDVQRCIDSAYDCGLVKEGE